MLELSGKEFKNEKDSLSKERGHAENNQTEILKLRKYINQNLEISWMALTQEWR